MEAPPRAEPQSLAGYLEAMTKTVFQSGLSWKVVEAKWDGIRAAFQNFDPGEVAALTPPDVDRLLGDTRIVRNRRKIEATVENAQQLLRLDREYAGFGRYLRSHGSFDATVADLKRRFKFLGERSAYHFLWVVGEEVPPYEEWCTAHGMASPHA